MSWSTRRFSIIQSCAHTLKETHFFVVWLFLDLSPPKPKRNSFLRIHTQLRTFRVTKRKKKAYLTETRRQKNAISKISGEQRNLSGCFQCQCTSSDGNGAGLWNRWGILLRASPFVSQRPHPGRPDFFLAWGHRFTVPRFGRVRVWLRTQELGRRRFAGWMCSGMEFDRKGWSSISREFTNGNWVGTWRHTLHATSALGMEQDITFKRKLEVKPPSPPFFFVRFSATSQEGRVTHYFV